MNLKSFKQNLEGRDFICSDIHGHFYLLESLLEANQFDQSKDRLFSLGDLIDRGDESNLVLDWLAKPWFNAIQGNHERMLIDVVESQNDHTRRQWFMWGGDWAEDLTDEELEEFYQEVSKLPAAIELEIGEDKHVALVHAELPNQCDWQDIKQRLLNAPESIERDPIISDMFWSKTQPYYDEASLEKIKPVKNIYHVFHGHSIVNNYRTITNRTFMDLGSYKTGEIGFLEATEVL